MWADRSYADIDRELDALAAAGARWVRFDVGWPAIESSKGWFNPYHLKRLDYVVAGARLRGIEPQVSLIGTPSWANRGAGYYVPPTDTSDFARFTGRLASDYKGRISYWEIWNEPNHPYFWRPKPDAAAYTRLLKAAYVAVKEANPDAKVISGGLSNCDKEFLQRMYDAGARGYFDYFGLHPYTGDNSPYYPYHTYNSRWNFAGIADMRAVMVANNDDATHIWASEMGWQTGTGGDWPCTEAQQAQYVGEAYARLFQEFPYVDALFIYDLRDDGTNRAVREQNFGLLRRDFSRKPGYAAFAKASMTWWPSPAVWLSPSVVLQGRSGTLGVRFPSSGARAVRIDRMTAGGGWVQAASTTTSALGTFQMSVTPTATTWFRAFSPDLEMTSTSLPLRVQPYATIRASRYAAPVRGLIRFTGGIVRVPRGRVILQRRSGRRWVDWRRAVTDSAGKYSITARFFRHGRYYSRVRFPGSATHLPARSRYLPITVY